MAIIDNNIGSCHNTKPEVYPARFMRHEYQLWNAYAPRIAATGHIVMLSLRAHSVYRSQRAGNEPKL